MGPDAKFFHSRPIKSKDLFQLSNHFFFVARKNIIVYDSAFNHSCELFCDVYFVASPIKPTPQFHAFSSLSRNLNFGPKSDYKINVGFGLVFSGSDLTVRPVSNSGTHATEIFTLEVLAYKKKVSFLSHRLPSYLSVMQNKIKTLPFC